jgi:predicted cobalt transporter CbtA
MLSYSVVAIVRYTVSAILAASVLAAPHVHVAPQGGVHSSSCGDVITRDSYPRGGQTASYIVWNLSLVNDAGPDVVGKRSYLVLYPWGVQLR